MAVDLREHVLEAAVLRVSLSGAADLVLQIDDPALVILASEVFAGDELIAAAFAPHAARALAALAEAAPSDPRIARLLGVWRPWLERRAGLGDGSGGGEAALGARFEARLAAIVAAMELAREEGDDDRAEALHARYIELGTSYATRRIGLSLNPAQILASGAAGRPRDGQQGPQELVDTPTAALPARAYPPGDGS